MTWNPIWPPALIVLLTFVLIAACALAASRRRQPGWWLRAATALLIGLALLRPGIGAQQVTAVQEEVDVLFLVDTTASVNAEDWGEDAPRLDGMKQDLAALAEAHPGARFGLISFDSRAVQRLPFTSDASALQSAVATLRPEITQYSRGSSVSTAAGLLREVLDEAQQRSPERLRIVYYLGDGEQTASSEPAPFSVPSGWIAGGAVLGYGTESGGRMLETLGNYDTGQPAYIQDPAGGDAVSRIDEQHLLDIAEQLGVGYQHRQPGTAVVAATASAGAAVVTGEASVERAFELYWILVIAAFGLLLRELRLLIAGVLELRQASGAAE